MFWTLKIQAWMHWIVYSDIHWSLDIKDFHGKKKINRINVKLSNYLNIHYLSSIFELILIKTNIKTDALTWMLIVSQNVKLSFRISLTRIWFKFKMQPRTQDLIYYNPAHVPALGLHLSPVGVSRG